MLATTSTMGHTQWRRHSQFLMPQKVLDVLTLMSIKMTKTCNGALTRQLALGMQPTNHIHAVHTDAHDNSNVRQVPLPRIPW